MAKYCMFCGEEIPNNAQFCPSCGKKQNESSQTQQKTNSYSVDDINDEMDLLLKYGMMSSNNNPKPKAQPKAIMIDSVPGIKAKDETPNITDIPNDFDIEQKPEVSKLEPTKPELETKQETDNVEKKYIKPEPKEEPIVKQETDNVEKKYIKPEPKEEPIVKQETIIEEKSIITEISVKTKEPVIKKTTSEESSEKSVPLEEQKSLRRGPKREIQKPKENQVVKSDWDDWDDFGDFDDFGTDENSSKAEDISITDVELEKEEQPVEEEATVIKSAVINRHQAARKDVSIKKRNVSIDDDDDEFSTNLKESSKNAMYETGKLLADETADINRRKNVKIEEDDEALDDRSHLEGRRQQTQKVEKRRQSVRKYNEKKFYKIEQDQSEIDENDIDYDGYYENVLPIDHDQERKTKINWKNILIVIVVIAALVGIIYLTLTKLL